MFPHLFQNSSTSAHMQLPQGKVEFCARKIASIREYDSWIESVSTYLPDFLKSTSRHREFLK